jgi:hypothetical protein
MLKNFFNKKIQPRTLNLYAIRLINGKRSWLSIGIAYSLEDFVREKKIEFSNAEQIDPTEIYLDNYVFMYGEEVLNGLVEVNLEEEAMKLLKDNGYKITK